MGAFRARVMVVGLLAGLASCAVTMQDSGGGEGGLGHPVFSGHVGFAGGSVAFDNDFGNRDDSTSGSMFRLAAEGCSTAGFGGGLNLEFLASDDDLFEGTLGAPGQIATVEVSPYFLYRLAASERFRMPIRVGPYLHVFGVEERDGADKYTWTSAGLRVAVEPEAVLARSRSFELSLFSELVLGIASADVAVDTPLLDMDFDSTSSLVGFEVGPRVRFSAFSMGLSFLGRWFSAAESDHQGILYVPGIDSSFTGLMFSVGARF